MVDSAFGLYHDGAIMKINAEKSTVKEWLAVLNEASKGEHYQKLWKRAYSLVEVPARRRHTVSVSKLDKSTKDGENIIVPGKVLSEGEMRHRINIAAMEFSEPALKRLKKANCNVVHIKDMLNQKNVRILI